MRDVDEAYCEICRRSVKSLSRCVWGTIWRERVALHAGYECLFITLQWLFNYQCIIISMLYSARLSRNFWISFDWGKNALPCHYASLSSILYLLNPIWYFLIDYSTITLLMLPNICLAMCDVTYLGTWSVALWRNTQICQSRVWVWFCRFVSSVFIELWRQGSKFVCAHEMNTLLHSICSSMLSSWCRNWNNIITQHINEIILLYNTHYLLVKHCVKRNDEHLMIRSQKESRASSPSI
jgi:hypothetical protein